MNFFDQEFGFNAQQVAAIMGAHSLGIMSRRISGFDGPNGWDLTNRELDNGFYRELVGAQAPNWRLRFVENGDLDGIPRRPQWEAMVDGRRLVMLHSDIALVRQIDEGVNINEDGGASCNFIGTNRCPNAAATFQHITRYQNSQENFLVDYGNALNDMIANGYEMKGGVCPLGQVCQLSGSTD